MTWELPPVIAPGYQPFSNLSLPNQLSIVPMKWTTKAFVQRVLAGVPLGKSIYYFGQRSFGGLKRFGIYSRNRVQNGMRLLKCLHAIGEDIEGKAAVEIGTGWTPIIPLLFWLRGQRKCYTYDISRLLKKSLLIQCAEHLVNLPIQSDTVLERSESIEEKIETTKIISLRGLIESGESADQILQSCDIHYHAPADAAATDLPNESIDLVYSNLVLGHVPQNEITSSTIGSLSDYSPWRLHGPFNRPDRSVCACRSFYFNNQLFTILGGGVCGI